MQPAVAPGVEQAQSLLGQQAFALQHAAYLAAEDLAQDLQVPVAQRQELSRFVYHAAQQQSMHMRVPAQVLGEGLDADYRSCGVRYERSTSVFPCSG
jgi:hypothetical protein